MTTPFARFQTPALQGPKDFKSAGLENELPAFQSEWNQNVAGWTESSIIGNPWTVLNDAPRPSYYNPLETGFGSDGEAVIEWTPFPNRLLEFFTKEGAEKNPQLHQRLTQDQVMAMADSGNITLDGKTYYLDADLGTVLKIPEDLCPNIQWDGSYQEFSPQGPRGWLDEYCEWSITYDKTGTKMQGVMFTCENPGYYLSMWQIDPKAVLSVYQQYLDPAVQLEDLYLRYEQDQPTGKKGEPVLDPTTGRPAYNPVNKWNNGTKRIPGVSGGAMHLTSPPNTLSAEVYLAAAATIQRPDQSSVNTQKLICCAKYGQPYRNSDPNIGFNANQAAAISQISLTDPIGLYIQQPKDMSRWQGPNGEDVTQYWKITRGTAKTGPNGSDQILHITFNIPESAGFCLNDITINDTKIDHIGVIADQMKIALSVTKKLPALPLEIHNCVADREKDIQPAPGQLLPENLFYGGSPIDLPARLLQGRTNRFVLVVSGADKTTTADTARIQFNQTGISAKVVEFIPDASAIPGLTSSTGTQAYVLDIATEKDVPTGLVQLRALNPGSPDNPSAEEHPWASGFALVLEA